MTGYYITTAQALEGKGERWEAESTVGLGAVRAREKTPVLNGILYQKFSLGTMHIRHSEPI